MKIYKTKVCFYDLHLYDKRLSKSRRYVKTTCAVMVYYFLTAFKRLRSKNGELMSFIFVILLILCYVNAQNLKDLIKMSMM